MVEQLQPKQLILPMHYGTKVFDALLPPNEFLEDQKNQKNVKRYAKSEITVEAGAKTVEPMIALLDWKN